MRFNIMTNSYFALVAQAQSNVSGSAADEVAGSISSYYHSIVPNLESLAYAVIILIIGWILAIELGKIVIIAAKKAGFDELFERAGVKKFLGRDESKWLISKFLGWITKWFILLIFITAAVNALGLPEVSRFLTQILAYLPNIVAAMAILTLGLLISQMVYEALHGLSNTSGINAYRIAGIALKYLIIIVTVLVILQQLGIQTAIIQIFAGGLALMLGLAGGLAFGLGGQGLARDFLEEVKDKLRQQ